MVRHTRLQPEMFILKGFSLSMTISGRSTLTKSWQVQQPSWFLCSKVEFILDLVRTALLATQTKL